MLMGYNVENVRRHNMKIIAKLLFKETLSCNEIAQQIGISETAVKKNISLLVEGGWVIHNGEEEKIRTRGGQHIRYKINEAYGCFVFINFSNDGDWFSVTDFSFGREHREKLTMKHVVEKKDVEGVISRVLRIIKQKGFGPLRGVAAAVPGQIDNVTGDFIYSSRFDRSGIKNLVGMLTQGFHAPVYVRNDTQFEVLGELEHEDFSDNDTVYYVSIGWGVSSVIVNNGKFIVGTRGISGEIGENITEDGENVHMHCSFELLIEKCRPYLAAPVEEALIKSFANDARVREIVLESADVLAKQLDGITNALGCDRVILMGGICAFGSEYAERINKYFNMYPKGFARKVEMSRHENDCFVGMGKVLCDGAIAAMLI